MSPSIVARVRLLPYAATIAFLVLMAIAEYQVRSSPKWPPPAQHELGAWQIDDPPVWTFAAALNLPATIPMLWAWQFSDRATYLMDDHWLIIYLPWTFLVFCCVVVRKVAPAASTENTALNTVRSLHAGIRNN